MLQDVLQVLIVANMRARQRLDHFAVNAARFHAAFFPQRLAFGRSAFDWNQGALLLAKLLYKQIGEVFGNFYGERFSIGMPYSVATRRSFATSRIT